MVLGGTLGLSLCFFDAILSYSDTAAVEYSGFKMNIPRYDIFLIRAVMLTLAGVIIGWGISKAIKWLFFFMAIPVLSMAQSAGQRQLLVFTLLAAHNIIRQATSDPDKDGIDCCY